jgi:uncharacterized protein (DUF2235 family)
MEPAGVDEKAKQMPDYKKRIIICCDGTYDDFGETPERTKPGGSSISRILRWILPPLVYYILCLLRIFSCIKRREIFIRGQRKPTTVRQSNVSRLATSILPYSKQEKNGDTKHVQQLVFYIGGIGALGTPQSRVEEAVTGNTMSYKIRYAYQIIMDNYSPGNEILLFGFSRGAFTVRALAGFIRWAGVLKENIEFFDLIWDKYIHMPKPQLHETSCQELLMRAILASQERQRGDSEDNHHIYPPETADIRGSTQIRSIDPTYTDVKIRCLGVWDTVGSLGLPPLRVHVANDRRIAQLSTLRQGPFDVALGSEVEHAFQALTLDECRFDFYLTIFSSPGNERPNRQVLSQTWLLGVHGDLGGAKDGHVGDYPIVWMVSKIVHNELLDLDQGYINEQILKPLLADDAFGPGASYIGPRDWVDRSWLPYNFFPYSFNFRLAVRNPHMTEEAPIISQANGNGSNSTNALLANDQKFHWTTVSRINKGENVPASYWDGGRYSGYDKFFMPLDWPRGQEASRSLKRRNPLELDSEITKEMIVERMDEAVSIDRLLQKHYGRHVNDHGDLVA